MHNFKQMQIWIKSMELVKDVYQLTESFPGLEKFGLISQMQRAAVSVPANIAEGSAKSSNKDFCRFLEISTGSLFELETLIVLSANLNYLDFQTSEEIQFKINEIEKMIYGFKQKLN
ncbi:four helix bundle protein [Paludibacter sp. 221]|uniref:four helix bundle protein n=1 Tax=Paludibacter sp. 221 TaxID=2302939 RepID=UPI0013D5344B|nr:four helix bundle protein [Paludibacter sp. 221]NDV45644.1 four helix bundle protein [Paludibacter sp. 221]